MNILIKKLLLTSNNEWGFNQISGNWNKIFKDPYNFIAVGDNGYYTTSNNGVSWSEPAQIEDAASYDLESATYNNQAGMQNLVYAFVGSQYLGVGTVYPDLQFESSTSGSNWQDVTFGNNKIVVVGQSSGYLATASSAIPSGSSITWTISTISFGSLLSPHCVKYISDLSLFVTAGSSGYVSTSSNGTTWATTTQIDSNIDWQDVIYDGNQIILLGSRLAGSQMSYISTSTDGSTWTSPVYIGDKQRSIAYGNNTYITCGDSGKLSTSIDLTNWTTSTTEIITNWKSIIAGNDCFVMVGNNYAAYKEF